jgi:hypothetical protein
MAAPTIGRPFLERLARLFARRYRAADVSTPDFDFLSIVSVFGDLLAQGPGPNVQE